VTSREARLTGGTNHGQWRAIHVGWRKEGGSRTDKVHIDAHRRSYFRDVMTTDPTCPVRATTRTVPLHLAILRRTSTFKPNLVSTRSRPVDQHVPDVPGLATRTRRLSRPRATAHDSFYELTCAPTLSPHARASSTRRNGKYCKPSHSHAYLCQPQYLVINKRLSTHTRPTIITCLFIYLHACLASITFYSRSQIDNRY
jgi:hypothetical protein